MKTIQLLICVIASALLAGCVEKASPPEYSGQYRLEWIGLSSDLFKDELDLEASKVIDSQGRLDIEKLETIIAAKQIQLPLTPTIPVSFDVYQHGVLNTVGSINLSIIGPETSSKVMLVKDQTIQPSCELNQRSTLSANRCAREIELQKGHLYSALPLIEATTWGYGEVIEEENRDLPMPGTESTTKRYVEASFESYAEAEIEFWPGARDLQQIYDNCRRDELCLSNAWPPATPELRLLVKLGARVDHSTYHINSEDKVKNISIRLIYKRTQKYSYGDPRLRENPDREASVDAELAESSPYSPQLFGLPLRPKDFQAMIRLYLIDIGEQYKNWSSD